MTMIEKMVGDLAGVKVIGCAVIIDGTMWNARAILRDLQERLPIGIWVTIA